MSLTNLNLNNDGFISLVSFIVNKKAQITHTKPITTKQVLQQIIVRNASVTIFFKLKSYIS